MSQWYDDDGIAINIDEEFPSQDDRYTYFALSRTEVLALAGALGWLIYKAFIENVRR